MWSVGYRTGQEYDRNRRDWDGAAPRPLAWSAWYPMSADRVAGERPCNQLFEFGDVALDGALADHPAFPVVLLSHGTGGSPESLGWLAQTLAQQGYVVIGAHHHGNTGREPYRAEGFICGWERAPDLSALLSILSDAGPFSGRLDPGRVHAVGFSLGGYTVLSLTGALSSMDRYLAWGATSGTLATGPREFPDVARQVPHLLERSASFRAAWARQGQSFRDARLRSVTAIAPAPPVRAFDAESLRSISIPVSLVTGEADTEAPSRDCADWLMTTNAGFQRISVGAHVGHYAFVGFPTRDVPDDMRFLFSDNPGVNRQDVHDTVARSLLDTITGAEGPQTTS